MSYAEPLHPMIRNDAFTAVQAAMMAIIKNDPAAAKRCIEIALNSVAIWRGGPPDPPQELES